MTEQPTSKGCTKCGAEKPLAAFSARKGGKLGRSSWCKACHSAYLHERRVTQNSDERYWVHRKAYEWALAGLRDRHRAEFDKLYQERAAGLVAFYDEDPDASFPAAYERVTEAAGAPCSGGQTHD